MNEVSSIGGTDDKRKPEIGNRPFSVDSEWASFSIPHAPFRRDDFERCIALRSLSGWRRTIKQPGRTSWRLSPSPDIDPAAHFSTSGIAFKEAQDIPESLVNYSQIQKVLGEIWSENAMGVRKEWA
jgi:hypothetical protein